MSYEEVVSRVISVLWESAAESFGQASALKGELLETPQVIAPLSPGDWAYTGWMMVKTQPGKQWGAAHKLREHVLASCERVGITLPNPCQEVWMKGLPSEDAGPDDERRS